LKANRFYAIAKQVAKHTAVAEKDIFSLSRVQPLSDARHLLFYMADREGFTGGYIKRFSALKGLDIHHSSIKYGIDKVATLLRYDKRWREIIQLCAT
tara:strand:- start:237 stop:527 length:291 start_codon:yes stop_codon:yes gene_type:complete